MWFMYSVFNVSSLDVYIVMISPDAYFRIKDDYCRFLIITTVSITM